MEADDAVRYARLKQVFLVEVGITLTLFVLAAMGETSGFFFEMPAGWFSLLILTTVFSLPMGLTLLWDRANPGRPIEVRRGLALGYLLITFVNALSFSIHMLRSSRFGFTLICPGVMGLLVLVLYLRLYRPFMLEEDSFP